jgi:hypothetical protein
MNKAVAGTFFTVPLLISGALYSISGLPYPTPIKKVHRSDVLLTSGDPNDALVLIPAENQEYAAVANALYLEPNGFDGAATVFITPDAGNEVQNVVPGVQALVQTIEADYTAGDLSATAPLYVFGYSEGAVEEGLAEQQLSDFGIPTDDLHFVMVGDSASAEGGFLNSFIDSLPESEQQSTTELFAQLGLTAPVLGATTPDDLYPTDVYSLTADGWTNWDNGANTYGMFTDHLEYLGLTPAEIATADKTVDGMTNYYTIDNANVNDLDALYNQFLLALDIAPSNVTTDAAATAATAAADPSDLLSEATTNFTDANQLLSEIPSGDFASVTSTIDAQDTLLQTLGFLDSAESSLSSYGGGALADLLNPWFASVDQGWYSASEAALNADQALETAVASGSATAEDTALLGLITPSFDALGPDLNSVPIIFADILSGNDPISAGGDLASGLDPSVFADLLSSIGL